jgi:hypothetical protein
MAGLSASDRVGLRKGSKLPSYLDKNKQALWHQQAVCKRVCPQFKLLYKLIDFHKIH